MTPRFAGSNKTQGTPWVPAQIPDEGPPPPAAVCLTQGTTRGGGFPFKDDRPHGDHRRIPRTASCPSFAGTGRAEHLRTKGPQIPVENGTTGT